MYSILAKRVWWSALIGGVAAVTFIILLLLEADGEQFQQPLFLFAISSMIFVSAVVFGVILLAVVPSAIAKALECVSCIAIPAAMAIRGTAAVLAVRIVLSVVLVFVLIWGFSLGFILHWLSLPIGLRSSPVVADMVVGYLCAVLALSALVQLWRLPPLRIFSVVVILFPWAWIIFRSNVPP